MKGDEQTEQRKLHKDTMKTDKNSQANTTTSGTLLQPEQAVSQTHARDSSVYEQITERIIGLLEKGAIPWHKTWDIQVGLPRNLISKKPYRGINVFLLHAMGYESAFWLTFRQALELGGNVRKAEKSCPVVFWKQFAVENKETGKEETIPLLRFYHVFNIDQCEGLRDLPAISRIPVPCPAKPEAIIEGMPQRPVIKHGMASPFYSPGGDFVGLPSRDHFQSASEYFATANHELIHACGHVSRLNRPTITQAPDFGSSPYCKEELIAEMGASFLCGHAGITESTIENSAAYIQGWLELFRNDTTLLVQAAAQAQRAADFILGVKREEGDRHE